MTRVIRRYAIPIAVVLAAFLITVWDIWIAFPRQQQIATLQEVVGRREEIDETDDREFNGDTQEHFNQNIGPLVDGIAKANVVSVYEGIARQLTEQEEIERGLIHRKTVMRHGFSFYEAAIPAVETDAAKLTALFSGTKTLSKYTGPQFCGGFHPDWCVEFNAGDDIYRVLICFGCREARLYGPTNEVFTDFETATYNDLIDILEPLPRERPMRQRAK